MTIGIQSYGAPAPRRITRGHFKRKTGISQAFGNLITGIHRKTDTC